VLSRFGGEGHPARPRSSRIGEQCSFLLSFLLYSILSDHSQAWFAYSHALGAAICLFSDLFSSIDEHLEESEIDRKKGILHLAAQMFDKYERITLPLLRQVVQTGSRILQCVSFSPFFLSGTYLSSSPR
jgi:hypothetical protein